MRLVLLALIACVCAETLLHAEIDAKEFQTRRANLQKALDGTLILFGASETAEQLFGFRQESNFFYLTGWTDPGALLLLTPAREILFLPHHDERRERYGGVKLSAEDLNARQQSGFQEVLPLEKFESELSQALSAKPVVYTLTNEERGSKIKNLYPLRDFKDAGPLVAKLRAIKSPDEIAAIQHATDITVTGHQATWKRMQPGMYEYQLAATLTYVFLENGCEGHAYSPIVGSGPNGTVLHYSADRRRMDRGETVVMDAAAECGYYASDVTRTLPVGGKFTARERELYDIVLGAQRAAIAAVKPGISMMGDKSLNQIAKDYIDSHGKDLHGQTLGKYFTHGLGHPVGIDVHDPNTPGPLVAGMVITIEPGIYIPEESIGIRIEDVVLVTENGAKVLSEALAKDPDEIEKALAR